MRRGEAHSWAAVLSSLRRHPVVVVQGGIGTGKSAVLRETARHTERPVAAARAEPFAPPGAVALELLAALAGRDSDSWWSGHRVWASPHAIVADLERELPVAAGSALLLVDDAEHLDEASAGILDRMTTAASPARLVLSLGGRATAVPTTVSRMLTDAPRHSPRPWDRGDIPLVPRSPWSAEEIWRRTAGNPLLVRTAIAGRPGTDLLIALLRERLDGPNGLPEILAHTIALNGFATVRRLGLLAGCDPDVTKRSIAILARLGLLARSRHGWHPSSPAWRDVIEVAFAPSPEDVLAAARLLHDDGLGLTCTAEVLAGSQALGDRWAWRVLHAGSRQALASGDRRTARRLLWRLLLEPATAARRAQILSRLGVLELVEDMTAGLALLQDGRAGTGDRLGAVTAPAAAWAVGLLCGPADGVRMIDTIEQAESDRTSQRLSVHRAVLCLMDDPGPLMATVPDFADQPMPDSPQAGANGVGAIRLGLHGILEAMAGERVDRAAVHAWRAAATSPADPESALGMILGLLASALTEDLRPLIHIDALARQMARGGRRLGQVAVLVLRAAVRLRTGDLRRASDDATRALESALSLGLPSSSDLVVAAAAILVECRVETDDLEAGRRLLGDRNLWGSVPERPLYTLAVAARGRWRMAAGDPGGAVADLDWCHRLWARWGAPGMALAFHGGDLALAASAMGDQATAQRVAGDHLALARRWRRPVALGRALRIAGTVTSGDRGADLTVRAVRILRCTRASLEHAHARVDLGTSWRRLRKRASAAAELTAGRETAAALGARGLVARAEAELAVATGRPDRDRRLTAGEARVAELIVAGWRYHDVAARLGISARTVESHVRAMYRKLGATTRTELVTILRESA